MSRTAHPPLSHAVFSGVNLTEADASAGLVLSTEAGWNQTEHDWQFLLGRGISLGFESGDGALVASSAIFSHADRLGWIGMVLVSPSARRQRLATALLDRTLAICADRRWLPALDATADGRQVYLPLGFRDLYPITRWSRQAETAVTPSSPSPIPFVFSIGSDLAAIVSWDAARFGVPRPDLIRYLCESHAPLALQFRTGAGTSGFCLGRPGRTATQIGPLVADTVAQATSLLSAALGRVTGQLLIDVPDQQREFSAFIRAHGFSPRRQFVRMIRDAKTPVGRPECIFATAGPEFG